MTVLKTNTRNIDNRRLQSLQIGKMFMKKLGHHVPWEGFGERAALMLIDRRRELLQVSSQPEKMRFEVHGKKVSYTPDYEVLFRLSTPEVWEIKGHSQLQKENVQAKLKAADSAIARSGKVFRVFNSRELADSLELRNAQLLRRYALHPVTAEQSAAILSAFRLHDAISLGSLVDAAKEHGLGREHLYALLYRGELNMNWQQLICDASTISRGTPNADL
jgi:hypothetical protein